jgi:nucleoside-diphosphate-sugar epimerase
VTGGTGTLGRHVVRRLRDAGRDVRILSRRSGTDEAGVHFVEGEVASRLVDLSLGQPAGLARTSRDRASTPPPTSCAHT